ncbi:MAG: hypothetical protein U9M92_01370 [Patescibacteria group bacterium]|nr:hypothetical protein [Patescibacteria group bacterium]
MHENERIVIFQQPNVGEAETVQNDYKTWMRENGDRIVVIERHTALAVTQITVFYRER